MTQYFFVGGNPKSGTTWMQLLLDAHPAITCSGEGHFVDRLLKGMFRVRDDYNEQLRIDADRVYQGKPLYRPLANDVLLPAARELIVRLMSQRATAESQWIGDKTPHNNRVFNDLRTLFPSALFINIVRHPYDVTVSRLHHRLRAGQADALDPASKTYLTLVRATAQSWRDSQERVARFHARHPKQLLQLCYEDALAEPHATTARLFSFLGASTEPAIVMAAVKASAFETLSGRAPGEEDRSSFYRKGVAGDWINTLDEKAIDIIDTECGQIFRQLGYRAAAEVR